MQTIRQINGYLIAPVLMLTGFRFSKDYRWGVSRFHRAVYACVDTVGANWRAGL
jgi:hypothetical protein